MGVEEREGKAVDVDRVRRVMGRIVIRRRTRHVPVVRDNSLVRLVHRLVPDDAGRAGESALS